MNGFLQDLRYAVRQSLKTPALTAIVIITIALGVGANTALFSVVNGVLAQSLALPAARAIGGVARKQAEF